MKKKKIDVETVFGLLPKQYFEKKKNWYCKVPIVLQLKGLEGLAGLRVFVLQYKLYCRLVRLGEGWLYHNTIECIVGDEVGKALYCKNCIATLVV